MMNAVRLARHSVLKPYLKPDHRALGVDQLAHAMHDEGDLRPVPAAPQGSGDRQGTVVFSCFNQDQELDRVDFACLRQRLRQNSVQEKLAALWIDRSLRRLGRSRLTGRHRLR